MSRVVEEADFVRLSLDTALRTARRSDQHVDFRRKRRSDLSAERCAFAELQDRSGARRCRMEEHVDRLSFQRHDRTAGRSAAVALERRKNATADGVVERQQHEERSVRAVVLQIGVAPHRTAELKFEIIRRIAVECG